MTSRQPRLGNRCRPPAGLGCRIAAGASELQPLVLTRLHTSKISHRFSIPPPSSLHRKTCFSAATPIGLSVHIGCSLARHVTLMCSHSHVVRRTWRSRSPFARRASEPWGFLGGDRSVMEASAAPCRGLAALCARCLSDLAGRASAHPAPSAAGKRTPKMGKKTRVLTTPMMTRRMNSGNEHLGPAAL